MISRHFELEPLEEDYRKLTTQNDKAAAARIFHFMRTIRYELQNKNEVVFEYRSGFPEPMVMRILKTEKDLDRWIETRFIRLAEFI
ncbi:MAG TPA: hypothetical protein VL651_09625 [Bacteroidia bacterium]|nr:hypothetical protein [Bacteroidia bacterium]